MLDRLVRTLPAGSILAVEAGRTLDEQVLPDLAAWDVRRYGGTRIAIRTLGPTVGPATPDGHRSGSPLMSPRATPRVRRRGRRASSAGAGYQALWAGGCVRDLILGPHAERLRRRDRRDARAGHGDLPHRTVPVGDSFGVVRVRGPPKLATRSRSPRSGATAPMSMAAIPRPSSSARPSSTPSGATSRSTACSSTRSPTR